MQKVPAADRLPSIPVLKITTSRWCWMGCRFCDMAEPLDLKDDQDVPAALAFSALPETWPSHGLIKVRGGLTVREPFSYWVALIRRLRARTAAVIEAFSPLELDHFQRRERRPLRELLRDLHWAGATRLGPGGGEWLVDEIRQKLSPLRIPSARWQEIALLAAKEGIAPTGLQLVAGFIDETSWQAHLDRLAVIDGLAHVEIKPLRPTHAMAPHPRPHWLDIVRVLERTGRRLPEVFRYVDAGELSPDAQVLFQEAGATAWFAVQKEITP